MHWMDSARRAGGMVWVGAGLVFQVWAMTQGVSPGPVTGVLVGAVLLVALSVLARRRWLHWAAGWLAAVLLALDFAGAVADRFGLFGPAGDGRVSWGSWNGFVSYTAQLLPGLDRTLVNSAAVSATVIECLLALLLVSGRQRRWVGKAAAGLLLVYLLAMTRALGLDEVASYALPVLIGGALLVSASPAHPRPPLRGLRGVRPAVDHRPAGSGPIRPALEGR